MLNLNIFRSAPQINPSAVATQVTARSQTLAQSLAGQEVTIQGFGKISPAHQQHLQAYGLLPGRKVQVLAQMPVTIVLVEQTELAFESEIAKQVWVE